MIICLWLSNTPVECSEDCNIMMVSESVFTVKKRQRKKLKRPRKEQGRR